MTAKNKDVDAEMHVVAEHAQKGEEKLSLATERLLMHYTEQDYDTFRRMTAPTRSAFAELVLDAYEQCAADERRTREAIEQAQRTYKSFVQLLELRNSADAERIRSASRQAEAVTAEFEAKYDMFKMILTRYVESKENK